MDNKFLKSKLEELQKQIGADDIVNESENLQKPAKRIPKEEFMNKKARENKNLINKFEHLEKEVMEDKPTKKPFNPSEIHPDIDVSKRPARYPREPVEFEVNVNKEGHTYINKKDIPLKPDPKTTWTPVD